jgi:LPXTG-motif cell wall-anchored protein
VTTLPATGAGESSDSSGILGAAALGAAAALYAAKKMRETPEATAEE